MERVRVMGNSVGNGMMGLDRWSEMSGGRERVVV